MDKKVKYSFANLHTTTAGEACRLYAVDRCDAHVDNSDMAATEVQDFAWLNFGGFDYLKAGYGQDVDIRIGASEDTMVFYLPVRGGMEIRQKHGHVISGAGPTAVAAQDCRGVRLAQQRRHIRIALARKGLMARLRLEGGASSRTPLKFQQSLEVGHHLSRGLAGLVLASFSAVSDIHTVPEVRLPALGGMIESALLHLWPNSFTDVLKSRQRIIFPKQVKLAMDLIAMDPFRAFIVSDIARECGVSIRTLQYGFRNFASCTIREFVLQQRIEHVARAQHDPEHLASLKATVGLRLLRKLNRLHERSHGRPLISRALLASDCCA